MGGPPPHRPARSVRRPNAASTSVVSNGGDSVQAGGGSGSAGMSKASKLAQAIQRDERERERDRRGAGSRLSFRSASPSGSIDGDADLDYASPPAQKPIKESPILNKAVSAFASAGSQAQSRSKQPKGSPGSSSQARPTRSRENTDRNGQEDGSTRATSRSRRGAVGVQGESARVRKTIPTNPNLPSNPTFREIERVLEQVAHEWPELLPPDLLAQPEGEAEAEDPDDAFDPVTLALALVDPDAPAAQDRFRSFLDTKDALHRSLQSSIRTHYRVFDSSVSSYNGLLSNISHAQKNATTLRSALEDVREMLGKGRAELGVLEARRTELNEIDKILVAIETLKNVPDRLEVLMSEKRFLSAAVLLVRSLKMINKQDLREVQATADLRAYFVSQENVCPSQLRKQSNCR